MTTEDMWRDLRNDLESIDLDDYRIRPLHQVLMPKSRTGFRVSTQLDPIDALVYAAILYESAEVIEKHRVPSKLGIVYSYRLKIEADGSVFERETGWPSYHSRSVELAKSGAYSHVLAADITDFYNQVSHHRVNNVLQLAGIAIARTKNIEQLLSRITARQSRGLPVGPSTSIAFAEAALDDVDKYLYSRGLVFVRYVDDFRIFCKSEREAIEAAHDLTNYLYTSHRLALASAKTLIFSVQTFIDGELLDPEDIEERRKVSKLNGVIRNVFMNTGYEIGFDDLPASDQNDVVRENLAELFDEALARRPVHFGLVRHLLRRAAHLRTVLLRDPVLEHLDVLAPAARDCVEYLSAVTKSGREKEIGDRLLDFALNGANGRLPFVRMWVLEYFCRKPASVRYSDAFSLAEESREHLGVRPIALLAKTHCEVQWVRAQKERWGNHAPWDRRAVILAGSILPEDEHRHWCTFIKDTSSDPLDRAVAVLAAQG